MNKPSEQDYAVAMEMLYADGEWYRFPRWVLKIRPQGQRIKPGVAHTLAACLNQSSFQKAVADHDGWFTFDYERAEEDTGYCKRQQEYHLKELIDFGLLERKRAQEIHAQRLLKINYPVLVKLMSKDCTSAKIAPEQVQSLHQSLLIEDKNVREKPLPTKKTTFNGHLHQEVAPQWLLAARQLQNSLRKHRRVARGELTVSAESFRLLQEEDGQEYTTALDWFCRHCSLEEQKKHELPSVENGKQFRRHFNWITDRMDRDRKTRNVRTVVDEETVEYVLQPDGSKRPVLRKIEISDS